MRTAFRPGPRALVGGDPVDVGARRLDARELARGHLGAELGDGDPLEVERRIGRGAPATAASSRPASTQAVETSFTMTPLPPGETDPSATQLRCGARCQPAGRADVCARGGVSQRPAPLTLQSRARAPKLDRMPLQRPYPELRASDAERERVVAFLREHALAGRLNDEELEERIGLAYAAVTVGDLERLIADLPRGHRPAPRRQCASPRRRGAARFQARADGVRRPVPAADGRSDRARPGASGCWRSCSASASCSARSSSSRC